MPPRWPSSSHTQQKWVLRSLKRFMQECSCSFIITPNWNNAMSTNSRELDKLWCGHIVGHHTAMKKNHHAHRHTWASLRTGHKSAYCVTTSIYEAQGQIELIYEWPLSVLSICQSPWEETGGLWGWEVSFAWARVTSDLLPSALAQWYGQSRCAVNAYRDSSVQEWTSSLVRASGCFYLERYKCLTYKSVPLDTKRSEWNGLRTLRKEWDHLYTCWEVPGGNQLGWGRQVAEEAHGMWNWKTVPPGPSTWQLFGSGHIISPFWGSQPLGL